MITPLPSTLQNITTTPHLNDTANPPIDSKYHYYGVPLVSLLCSIIVITIIFTIVGNTMVILTIIRHKGMRTRTNMFLVNLAVADILVAILNMPISLLTLTKGKWIFGTFFCKMNGFSMGALLICSIHTLMYISIHKYISITRPFSRVMTPRRILLMIAATWIWSIACGMSPLLGWNEIIYKKGASQCGPALPTNWVQYSHSIFITTTNYIIPLAVMSFCYINIFREINQHLIRLRETSNIDLSNSIEQQKKITVTLVLVLACFLLCWTPFVVYSSAVSVLEDKKKMPLIVNPVAYWCGYINSACNPIIYALRSPSFRRGYQMIMCDYYMKRSPGKTKRRKLPSSGIKAYSAPCSPSAKIRHIEQRTGSIPWERHNKVLLSQTSWSSLPFMTVQRDSSRRLENRMMVKSRNDPPYLIKKQTVGSSNDITQNGESQMNSPVHLLNKRVIDSQDSSESSLTTSSSVPAHRSLNKKAFRSCYVRKPLHCSASDLIRSASLSNLDSVSDNPSDSEQSFEEWTMKMKRLRISRKKKKDVRSDSTPKMVCNSVMINCDIEKESQM